MNETDLLATLQVVFVLLCGVLVFSLVCTIVEAIREYRRTRVVKHTAKHSRGPEVPVSCMVVPKSAAGGEGATAGEEGAERVEYTSSAPQDTVGVGYTPSEPTGTTDEEGSLNTPQESNSPAKEPKQTWSQPTGYSRAKRKRHARHGR